jgi:hypothetical protein
MKTRIEIKRKNAENTLSILRKFTRKVRNSGFLMTVRKNRYFQRKDSDLRTKGSALNRIAKRAEFTRLFKLGKIDK